MDDVDASIAFTIFSCNCLAPSTVPGGISLNRIENAYHWPSFQPEHPDAGWQWAYKNVSLGGGNIRFGSAFPVVGCAMDSKVNTGFSWITVDNPAYWSVIGNGG